MASIQEVVKTLYDKRRGIVEQMRQLQGSIEGDLDGEGNAEAQASFEAMDKEQEDIRQRIDNLLTITRTEQEAAEQRETFRGIFAAPAAVEDETKNTETMLRNWLKAGLPNAEQWAPRALEFDVASAAQKFSVHPRTGLVEYHDLTKGAAPQAGPTVPTGFVDRLYQHLVEFAATRRTNAAVLTTASGENLLVPKTATHGAAQATWIAEGGAIGGTDPTFAQITLGAFKAGQMVKVSTELVQDESVDLLGYLAEACGRNIGLFTGAAYVNGTGSAQPEGWALTPTVGKTGATGQTLTVIGNDLIDLYHSLVSGYRARGFWVMNDLTAAFIRKIRDDTGGAGLGNFLWQPGLVAGAPDTLLGRPVITDPNVAVMAANAHSIAFGDFSLYYTIRDVAGVRFERSDDFAFNTDQVTFRCLLRTDGRQIINGAGGAVKFYRNSAT